MAESTKSYRHTASFGKRQEFVAMGELLRQGLDVYMTLVDDQGIDCVVRREVNGKPDYLDIQIKARSADCKPNSAGRFVPLHIPNPRKNLYYIFFSEQADTYWVFPSLKLVQEANQNKTGKNAGRYSINLTNYSTAQKKALPRPRFKPWEGKFELLKPSVKPQSVKK